MIDSALKTKLMTYITTALAASSFSTYRIFGPNDEDPEIESLQSSIILIDLDDVENRQFALGSRSTRKEGFITVTLLVKKGQGLNLVSEFKGFMDTIGLQVSNNVRYKAPVEVMVPDKYKEWKPTSVALPYQTENYV